jgi:hypothetical protein
MNIQPDLRARRNLDRLKLLEPARWPDPVDGAQLLSDLSRTIRRYVIMRDHMADASAVWVAYTYLIDSFHISPRFAITSTEKQCGKTTTLDVLSHHLAELASKAAHWCTDYADRVRLADPIMPARAFNRIADNWRLDEAFSRYHWDWPGRPDGIRLHPQCEEGWYERETHLDGFITTDKWISR